MSKDWRSQAHVTWECKYHVVILPKYRQKVFYGKFRRQVSEILRELCRQKEVELIEGNAAPDHIHMLLSVPPKDSIAHTVGFLKGKSAIRLNKEFSKAKSISKHFWIRGYFVSTVGLNEKTVRDYIKNQELSDKRQLDLPEFD